MSEPTGVDVAHLAAVEVAPEGVGDASTNSAGPPKRLSPGPARISRARGHSQLVLTFHGLGEPPPGTTAEERHVWVPAHWLDAILDAPLHADVFITFDDGNVSDFTRALPALQERGLTARFFPVAGRLGQDGYLGAAQLQAISRAGMTVGSQGMEHTDWRCRDDASLRRELCGSRAILSEVVGDDVTEAACPFGSYDRRVLRALRAAGYTRVFNSDGRSGRAGAWVSPRTTVDRGGTLEQWVHLARHGAAAARPGPLSLGKRLVKRIR